MVPVQRSLRRAGQPRGADRAGVVPRRRRPRCWSPRGSPGQHRFGPVEHVALVIRSGRGRARLDRDRSDLVATVAHELRSPLTGVKGFVATLLSKWDRLNDDQKKLMLTTVHADADRLTRLIAELLDVARIDTGRLPLYPRPVDFGAARRPVRRVGARRHRAAASSRRTPTRCRTIFADPDKLPRSSPTSWTTRSGTARAPCASASSRSTRRPSRGALSASTTRATASPRHPHPGLHQVLEARRPRRHRPGHVHRQRPRHAPRRRGADRRTPSAAAPASRSAGPPTTAGDRRPG